MKILVLLSASLFGFGFIIQDALEQTAPATPAKIVYVESEEPVATFHLDTIEVVYEAPAPLAGL